MSKLDYDVIEKLLSEDKLHEILDVLAEASIEKDAVSNLKAQLSDADKQQIFGTNSPSERIETRNKIRVGLQTLLRKIKNETPSIVKTKQQIQEQRIDGVGTAPNNQDFVAIENALKMKNSFPNSFIPQDRHDGHLSMRYLTALREDCVKTLKFFNSAKSDWHLYEVDGISLLTRIEIWLTDLTSVFASCDLNHIHLHDVAMAMLQHLQGFKRDLGNENLAPFLRAGRLSSKKSVVESNTKILLNEINQILSDRALLN
jgi:hypothetical protein